MKLKKLVEVSLGIITGIGGFLDVGTLATSADAGAAFGFQLLWVVAAGVLCLILLVEMSGRFTAVSGKTILDATRERFGFPMFVGPFTVLCLGTWVVLGAEIAGTALALELASGIGYRWWVMPVAAVTWLVLWYVGFGKIEKVGAIVSLITVAFVVAVVLLHPPWGEMARGLVPSLPRHDAAHYWFVAASILGATLTPYVFYFYSSGAVEDRWGIGDLGVNRFVAWIGLGLGGVLAAAILIVAALTLEPRGILVESYEQIAPMLIAAFGRWGFPLFVVCFAVIAFTSAVELALAMAYMLAQGLGWNWSKNVRPREAARFSVVYSLAIVSASLLALGLDPLRLTMFAMALASATLPFAVAPFLVVMNDEAYVGRFGNARLTNAVVVGITGLAFVVAVISIPLEVLGGS